MKLRNLSILAGIFTLSLTAIPFAVTASPLTSQSQIVAQAQPRKANRGKFAQELGLTDAQKTRLAEIRQTTKTQIEQVLTPEQRAQWQAAKQNRQARRGGFQSLNLTDDQKAQINRIRESSKTQMEAVFTPEQKQKMEQMRQGWRQRRQQQNR
ncbi:MAG: P pilus assembly/Cpx signaling pathway, periplasmic inhibitor/zinc-resistance associated protein [Calothrix sp. C42_A2020_038]|nr:P pilus assembly/Cpx signaling pathway, periplasmic inhibitor/zinc-resistance associated protein [Calothrix sp. C42_A2020_038]